jgi:hypothetical protein
MSIKVIHKSSLKHHSESPKSTIEEHKTSVFNASDVA